MLHSTWRTKRWWKMPDQPVAADFHQSISKRAFCPPPPAHTQGVQLSFSSTVPKVWRVELEFPILQGIPTDVWRSPSWIWNPPGRFSCHLTPLPVSEIRSVLLRLTLLADILSRKKFKLIDIQNNSMVPESELRVCNAVRINPAARNLSDFWAC